MSGNNVEEQVSSKWGFSNIYPNPGRGAAFVTVTVPNAQRIIFEVVNVAGQLVAARNEQMMRGENKVALPVERLASGAYLIRFKDVQGKTLNAQQYTRN